MATVEEQLAEAKVTIMKLKRKLRHAQKLTNELFDAIPFDGDEYICRLDERETKFRQSVDELLR